MTDPADPLIVTVAPNGARKTKADHPAVPIRPDEIARDAAQCLAAGAAMLHLHVRDDDGRHSLDADRYRAAIDAVRDAVGDRLVIQVTTEAAGRYEPPAQMQMVRDLRPEAVSLSLGEIAPAGGGVRAEAMAETVARDFLEWLAAEEILAQFILYSAADVRRYHDLSARAVVPGRRHFLLFVLGRYSAVQRSRPGDLLPFLAALEEVGENHDGAGSPWGLCAFGPLENACAIAGAALGGHVRVGFENNLALKDGRVAADNAALVGQVREGAAALGRELADGRQARSMMRQLLTERPVP